MKHPEDRPERARRVGSWFRWFAVYPLEVGAVAPQPELGERPTTDNGNEKLLDVAMSRSQMMRILVGLANKQIERPLPPGSVANPYVLFPHFRPYVSHLIGAVHALEAKAGMSGDLDAVEGHDVTLSYRDVRALAGRAMDGEVAAPPEGQPSITSVVALHFDQQFAAAYTAELHR